MQAVPHFGVWKQGNHLTPGDSVEWITEDYNKHDENIKLIRHGVVIGFSTTTSQVGYKRKTQVAIIYIKSKNYGDDDTISYPLDEYGQPKNYNYTSKYGELRVTEKFFIEDFNIERYTSYNTRQRCGIVGNQNECDYARNLIRQFTMRAKKVDYIQKAMEIKIENVGARCVVSVKFASRVGSHSIERSAPLDLIPPRKKPDPPKPPPPPPPETRLRLFAIDRYGYSMCNSRSYWVEPEDCVKVSDIPEGIKGIVYIEGRKRGMFDENTNTINSIESDIFPTACGTEYYVKDKSKMETYTYIPPPKPPTPPPSPPPPTWAEKNQHLSRYCKDPFGEMDHTTIMSLVGDKNKYAIGDILSSDGMPIPRFTGLINGGNRTRKMVIVVGIFKQERKDGSKFPASTETFAVFAEYKGIQISASSLSENKVIIGKKTWRHPPDWPLRPTRATHTNNVAELFARTWGDDFQYTFEKGNCEDIHKDKYYMEKMKDVEFCSLNHPKKASFCRNVVEKTHPVLKTPFSRSCMTPCTPNPSGMCEVCNPEWKEPESGCSHPSCCGPYALGRTENEYRRTLLFTEIKNTTIYVGSAFSENVASVQYQ